MFIKPRQIFWYKPECHTTRTSDYTAAESKFCRNSINICRILRSSFFAEVLKFRSVYKKIDRRYEQTVCTLGGCQSMLYNMQKESKVYLSPIFFLETRNDDQVKRLVKAVELNPKSPKKMHSLFSGEKFRQRTVILG